MKTRDLTNILLTVTGLCLVLTGLGLATVELDFFEEVHLLAGVCMSALLCLHVFQHRHWFLKHVFKNKSQ
jgi:hypothetical protein